MLRKTVKTAAACALSWSRADRAIRALAGPPPAPFIVAYHRVVADYRASLDGTIPAMLISLRTLERHIDWIASRYRIVSLDELALHLEHDPESAGRLAAVTFDDGYADFYHAAFPLLRRKGVPAAVFVVTDLVGTGRTQSYDLLYLLLGRAFARWKDPDREMTRRVAVAGGATLTQDLPRPVADRQLEVAVHLLAGMPQSSLLRLIEQLRSEFPPSQGDLESLRSLDWSMIAEMSGAGITIGSHTRSHPLLTNESYPKVKTETTGSRALLEQRLSRKILHFAYPDGRYNQDVLRAVEESGYRYAYTTCPHRDPQRPALTIPRRVLWERSSLDVFGRFSPAIMSCQANAVFDVLQGCRQDHLATLPARLPAGVVLTQAPPGS